MLLPAVSLALATLTFSAFSGTLGGTFLIYDDKQYVTENPVVRAGLAWSGVTLALTRSYASNWHPLTWISLMLDVDIFGLDPWGFHLTNNLLHTANAVLLFLLVRSLTGSLWRSAAVAALFAVHPLRVESVAWIAERKDVLAAFFGFLALLAYVRHVRRPGTGSYLITTLLFTLGLMAKPVLVSWPLLMLVLDAWPLGRFAPTGRGGKSASGSRRAATGRLLLEKAPWFVLAAIVSVFTFVAQSKGGAVVVPDELPGQRILNILWAYGAYLGKALWPTNLAAFYPLEHRSFFSPSVLCSVLLLTAITCTAKVSAGRRPWIAAGWSWYLISLVPMIGAVRVGWHSMADRNTYIPLIGPAIAMLWLIAGWANGPRRRAIAAGGVIAITLVLAWMTRIQATIWLSNAALFTHMVEAVPGNYIGFYGLGVWYHEQGDVAEAERNYLRSITSNPRYYESRIKLARLYLESGRLVESEKAFRLALELEPDDAMALSVFGLMLHKQGNLEEAAEHLRKVVDLSPRRERGPHEP